MVSNTNHEERRRQTPFQQCSPGKEGFLDLSGYGFSGKHAITDLMREFRGYHVEHFAFEFNLFRVPGGILDLEAAICNGWSLIRTDAAVRRFERVIRRMGTRNRWTSPRSWFRALGMNWEDHYNGHFFELAGRYLDQLVEDSWVTNWPYPLFDVGAPELFLRKLGVLLRLEKAGDFVVRLTRPERFVRITKEFVQGLLTCNVEPSTRVVVMHNAFEPYQPERCFRYFDNVRSIVVDRDARDNFAQHWKTNYRPMQLPVESFIRRFKAYRDMTARYATDHPGVLRVNFEEAVLDYETTVKKMLEHLGEERAAHERPRAYFDPAVSKKNIGIWKQHPRQDEIERVADSLSAYCRDDV